MVEIDSDNSRFENRAENAQPLIRRENARYSSFRATAIRLLPRALYCRVKWGVKTDGVGVRGRQTERLSTTSLDREVTLVTFWKGPFARQKFAKNSASSTWVLEAHQT
jgi:hypothetical protein